MPDRVGRSDQRDPAGTDVPVTIEKIWKKVLITEKSPWKDSRGSKNRRHNRMETSKKILALDSSGLVASVAVVEGNSTYSNLLAEYTVNYKKTHSQTLLPMLDEIANMTELDLTTIDAIAIAAGPGSFTGLRIGSATAKGLGLALKKTVDFHSYGGCPGI